MLHRPSGRVVAALAAAVILADPGRAGAEGGPPTDAEARAFVEAAELRLLELSTKAGRAAWVQANFITDDTERIAADLNKDLIAASMELAKAATRFDAMARPPERRSATPSRSPSRRSTWSRSASSTRRRGPKATSSS